MLLNIFHQNVFVVHFSFPFLFIVIFYFALLISRRPFTVLATSLVQEVSLFTFMVCVFLTTCSTHMHFCSPLIIWCHLVSLFSTFILRHLLVLFPRQTSPIFLVHFLTYSLLVSSHVLQ